MIDPQQQSNTPSYSRVATYGKDRPPTRKRNWQPWFWSVLVTIAALLTWFFFMDSGRQVRYVMADSIIITQHRHWAKYLIGQEQLAKRVAYWESQAERMAEIVDTHEIAIEQSDKPIVNYEPISGTGWKGYLLTISDPRKIRVIVTNREGSGEKVSDMVKRTGALAGVNAGGFVDTNWQGNGFVPIGLVISGGKTYFSGSSRTRPQHVVGIDKEGKMVAGRYTLRELEELGVSEAVTFSPRFIVNGKGQIDDPSEGWGIAPRTAMAQKADGTIMFAVIDGRQPHSLGATLYDIQNVFLEHGAVIAANLDGGASTVLVVDDKIVNKPSSRYGERYIPTAFLVFDDPKPVLNPNLWEGRNPKELDAVSKKGRRTYNNP